MTKQPSSPQAEAKLIWMDLEMTGLNPAGDTILEVAVLISDLQLKQLTEGPCLVLQHEATDFSRMDAWNQNQHTRSGLWQKALDSQLSLGEAQKQIMAFLKQHVGERQGILAGNSIWQDRRFLIAYMPQVHDFLHYRMLDVSSLKILVQSWYPDKVFKKQEGHRALDDIRESIAELRYYRQHCFLASSPV